MYVSRARSKPGGNPVDPGDGIAVGNLEVIYALLLKHSLNGSPVRLGPLLRLRPDQSDHDLLIRPTPVGARLCILHLLSPPIDRLPCLNDLAVVVAVVVVV